MATPPTADPTTDPTTETTTPEDAATTGTRAPDAEHTDTTTIDDIGQDILTSVSRVQDAALSVSRDWINWLAEYVPPVPGVPADVLEGPAQLLDRSLDRAEDAIGGSSTFLGAAVHRERDFVMDVFGVLQPIVNALSANSSES